MTQALLSCPKDVSLACSESSTAQMPHFQLGQWEGHVLANLPFYQLLFPVLLTLLRSRVSSRTTACLRDAAKVCLFSVVAHCSGFYGL